MPLVFEKLAQAQLAGHAAEQLARLKVDGFRGGQRLAVGIAVKFGNIVACVRFRVSVDGVVIKDT